MPVYLAGLSAKNALRRVGVLKEKKLAWPVVSVGSLSAGGAGKTPVVIALAKLMQDQGWGVDVLSRGYGREGKGVERVATFDSARYGDEPVLVAQASGVPVWVGSERYKAGLRAEASVAGLGETDSSAALRNDMVVEGGRQVHLLDDGFQHRQLARSLDVVLLTTADLDDALLPAGNLREGRSAIRRADILVIREKEFKRVRPRIGKDMSENTLIWLVRRRLEFPKPLGIFSAGLRPLAFCAIARPDGFLQMLKDAGCGVLKIVAFADHHVFTDDDVSRLLESAERANASGFFTTEKDAVKLSPALRERLEKVGPVVAVPLVAEFVDQDVVVADLKEALA